MLQRVISPVVARRFGLLVLVLVLAPAILHAQPKRDIEFGKGDEPGRQTSSSRPGVVADGADDREYGQKFFEQLRLLFGRFRDAELRDAFDAGKPIDCYELISDKGEWREVAFFNEDRKLGDWYRRSIEEVKGDPSLYAFKGMCANEHGAVQLTTKFPVDESVDQYNRGRISFDKLVLHENAPVRVGYNSRAEVYAFDLPYLYLVSKQGDKSVYSLHAPKNSDRDRYATDVTDRWNCKSVGGEDVTYHFLICHTWTVNLMAGARSNLPFGASAYIILSDGQEASSSVKLVFGDDHPVDDKAADKSPKTDKPEKSDKSDTPAAPVLRRPEVENRPAGAAPPPPRDDADPFAGREVWIVPNSSSKVIDVNNEFRIRFSPQTWTDKLGAEQMLLDQKLVSSTTKPAAGVDYCTWRPSGSANLLNRLLDRDPDASVAFSVKALGKDRQSDASLLFEMKTHTGVRLGALQCYFRQIEFADGVQFSRWVGIVGSHVALEVRP